ncbi:DUF202 domain-containing protein [Streptomyces fuscigenes]|uniref:DUF202 domain-containing protein n=1 Tax=Streptomyces fuscigenes TaxID=1528880 RepID=UPI001F230ADB|nr:DUF202 domain-containing protein [Streptomyces fuscigenes]MCF3961539.1 DUF202 domain-containing protein [Streptomyces fuscigenes]
MTTSSPGDPPADERRDPGLQPERTRLAWRRTTLACTVAAILAVRQAVHDGAAPGGLAAVALGALVWLAFLAVAHRRTTQLAAARPPRMSEGAARTAAVCAVCLAALGAALLL